jgi:D-alanine-D-alanine ligase
MNHWSETVKKDLAQVNVAALGKVGVLLGGKSGERDISLMSGKGVLDALISKGVNAHAFDPGQLAITELAAQKFDRTAAMRSNPDQSPRLRLHRR